MLELQAGRPRVRIPEEDLSPSSVGQACPHRCGPRRLMADCDDAELLDCLQRELDSKTTGAQSDDAAEIDSDCDTRQTS